MTKHTWLTILVAAAWCGKGLYDAVIARDWGAVGLDLGGLVSTLGVKSLQQK